MLEVRRPGPLTTVQDLGRHGFAHLGVSPSGALDRPAFDRANRLVGNAPGDAGLEITLGGCALRATARHTVAVTGAPGPLRLDGVGVPGEQAMDMLPGQVLEVGNASRGLRRYLAVSGGIAVRPVLGSRSHDSLSGLGPPPLRAGDVLPIGPASHPRRDSEPLGTASIEGDEVVLRARLGPRDDWFADPRALGRSAYTVSPLSNRVGVRLTGPSLTRSVSRELPSEGLITGAVQVPADGHPLIFLNDHPATGGYPVIAVVEATDLALVAQARPGSRIRFRLAPWT